MVEITSVGKNGTLEATLKDAIEVILIKFKNDDHRSVILQAIKIGSGITLEVRPTNRTDVFQANTNDECIVLDAIAFGAAMWNTRRAQACLRAQKPTPEELVHSTLFEAGHKAVNLEAIVDATLTIPQLAELIILVLISRKAEAKALTEAKPSSTK